MKRPQSNAQLLRNSWKPVSDPPGFGLKIGKTGTDSLVGRNDNNDAWFLTAAGEKFAAALITNERNVRYLSGFTGNDSGLLITPNT